MSTISISTRGKQFRKRKASTVASLAKKVNKNTRILASKELGRVRVDMDTTPSTTAVVQNVSFVAQGDDVFERHGRKIHAKSVSISGSMQKNATSTGTKVRFMLFRDNLGTTTAPSLTDVFTDENDFFDNKHRLVNESPMKRFTILWDKFIILNENFDGEFTIASFKFSKKLNFDILYTGTGNTDEGKNSLWFMSASDEATNVPGVTGDIVFKYSDL